MIVSTTAEVKLSHINQILKKTGKEILVFPSIEMIPSWIRKETEILITFGNDLTNNYITEFPKLKWIQVISAGIEDLPFKAIEERGIVITNVSGIHVKPMAEYVLYCLLHFEKDMARYQKLKREKMYDRTKLVGELVDREILIYGTGTIGQEIAKVLSFMGTKVYGVNTSGRKIPYFIETVKIELSNEKLASADYVISILPSTSKTKGLFSKEYLNSMKSSAVFINIGRGDAVDTDAILEMLKHAKLKGAALDVFNKEPLPETSALWDCDKLILTPHMSAKSIHYVDRSIDIFIENLIQFRAGGQMNHLVDIGREY